jgi:ribonuclease HIII
LQVIENTGDGDFFGALMVLAAHRAKTAAQAIAASSQNVRGSGTEDPGTNE